MEPIKVILAWTRETKATHRYDSMEADQPLRTLYVPKSHLPDPRPARIMVTVEASD